jgi:O-antigen/teichoic acid export membrane protein
MRGAAVAQLTGMSGLHRGKALTLATLRDAAALSLTGVLAKAMGLVVSVLVARFHGPEGLGTFALLLSVTLLLEQASRFGVPELLIRDAGARPEQAGNHWRNGLRATLTSAALPTLGLIVAASFFTSTSETRYSMLLMSVSMPLSAMAGVGQSVNQARGRALYVAWVSFAARAASLIALVALLVAGMGIVAAFISRVIFEGLMAVMFATALRRLPPAPDGKLRPGQVLQRALPFAIGRMINEGSLRAPLLCVSAAFALSQVGLFDSADRVGQSFQSVAAAGVVALIPVFSRSVAARDPDSPLLIGYSLKYTSLLVSLGAYVIAAFAGPVIGALYGRGFAKAAELLPILLLAQSLMSAEIVLRQALFAHGREYAIIGTGATSLAIKVALIAGLSWFFGLEGAAYGVLISSLSMFAIDLRLARRAGLRLDATRFLFRPVACVAVAFVVIATWSHTAPVTAFVTGLAAFAIAAAILRVFPADERRFLMQVARRERTPRSRTGTD